MSRFTAIVPLVNHPFEHVPNIFAASTDDPQSLITTLGYIDDIAYPPNITTPEFVSPPIPLLKTSDILYIISSANTIKLFGVYFVTQVGQSFQLVLTPSGGNVQPHSLALDSLSGLITSANQMIYTTAPNVYATSPITALALTLMSNGTQAQMQATLGIITLTPSDPLKTFIASVDSPVIVGQLARFSDINGTVQSSGIAVTDILLRANNLIDLTNVVTARFNLGLGSASVQDITFFLQVANNLSDLNNVATARTNLGLGTAATQDNSFFLQVLNNLSDLNNTTTARNNLGLGTASTKAASDATKAVLVSINGSTTINNVAIFSDTNGTIIDSGLAFSGFQPSSPALTSIAGLATLANQMLYTTAPSTYAVTSLTPFSRGLLALASAAAWQNGLGLGTASTQNSTFFLQVANNLSDLASVSTARTNLGLGTAAVQNIAFFLQSANNLSDVASVATSRTNLGLGTAAIQNVAFFLQSANNLSDIVSAATARTNLGLGTSATKTASDNTKTNVASVNSATTVGHVATFNDTAGTITDGGVLGTAAAQNINFFLQSANNLSDVVSAANARTNLGLGTAATQNNSFFLQSANNLSDVASAATSRTNLGLGTAATKAASNNAQATVASVSGTITIGHVATFNDTVGTIVDGGILGTAAFKTASNNAQTGVASTSGAFVVNNIVVAADTTGTIKDGGSAISGFVPTSRTLTAAGLVTGGGDLSANRSFTVTAAVQADQEAATSNTVAVTPGSQLYHPSSIKAAGTLHEAASPTWLHQYNFTTITRNAAGSYTLTMAVTFSSANYQVVCTPNDGTELVWSVDQKTTTSFRLRSWTLAGILLSDGDFGIMVTGDLA
jgi:hypothetical protein